MECRQQQLALFEMGVLVEQDDGVASHGRLEHPRSLSRVQDLGRGGEELLYLLGIRQDHERRLEGELDRDPLAVLLTQPLERRRRPLPRGDQLKRARDAGAWRELAPEVAPARPRAQLHLPAPRLMRTSTDTGTGRML